jgi:hypothetical protein
MLLWLIKKINFNTIAADISGSSPRHPGRLAELVSLFPIGWQLFLVVFSSSHSQWKHLKTWWVCSQQVSNIIGAFPECLHCHTVLMRRSPILFGRFPKTLGRLYPIVSTQRVSRSLYCRCIYQSVSPYIWTFSVHFPRGSMLVFSYVWKSKVKQKNKIKSSEVFLLSQLHPNIWFYPNSN